MRAITTSVVAALCLVEETPLDDVGRLARVIIELQAPYAKTEEHRPLLSLGSFVAVEIDGRLLRNVIAIPRSALRADNTVWVANAAKQLEIRRVMVTRLTATEALVESGLEAGEQVILTNLQGAAQGLTLRPVEKGES